MKERTFFRFQVEINIPGFPADGGDNLAKVIEGALLQTAQRFDPDATVKETTE